ncbi:UDP-GlcNAc:betaGal beta-1,3-N-acetylglucosaminyltransferase-like protein 1 isoform X2 [Synchiropus splendidus]|uniref:UDP-GlcNAc:betaGal beta-1,3-N-acetylglucosaminyltransferase-like protein 1 isoform X2 n=1 Tax=Synchiropus splendidus TaxID=270530 RepID=UPI00237ED3C9|nr:UDP-GlcNAc:betaGal beta-1,3-N-acetylglucosaminyltransferase-like protein 1 isoform X2 [Synchiropus splendidus]
MTSRTEDAEVTTAPCKRQRGVDAETEEVPEQRMRTVDVSLIMPVHNAACWLDECLQAIILQDFTGVMELSVFDDASTDESVKVVEAWRARLEARGVSLVLSGHKSPQPKGVGFAKNKAINQSSGKYLCFQDADDVMLPERVRLQFEASLLHPSCVYTSHGPTVIMPTWFCSRDWFLEVGLFDEGGKGVAEDLLFFYQSLRQGGGAVRVDQCLLVYRYHEKAATHSVTEETIWNLRVNFLQERVISQWQSFTIWNAGKQGRKLFRYLNGANQKKVKAFCDVDEKKIKKGFYTYEDSKERPKRRVPIVSYKDASPPFIVCVKLDMTGGILEENINSLNLVEGVDYYHFN